MTTDDSSLLPPPPTGSLTPATPSGLTPNTRSEAEAALSHNTIAQTDSAAPTTPLPIHSRQMGLPEGNNNDTAAQADESAMTEAQRAYRRPAGPLRASSTNYADALLKAREASSSTSDSPAPASDAPSGFPHPGHGVVPLNPGISSGQAEVVRKAKPSGLSLGALGRQQSWKEQDRKHLVSQGLMAEVQGDAGYGSGAEGRGVGY